ncbi:lipoprotein [Caballeronia arationis]|uniref:DUF3443 domain-containing protein n=1 Tax=Caballeronia arationis TaxID=1777142 RepID=UPI00074B46D1|nr:DUF3443 domain-containing protein [Caballeronia arationis]SAK61589.1 lipoprotein [Caballeronia arationis]
MRPTPISNDSPSRFFQRALRWLSIAMLATALAACGGGDDNSSSSSSGSSGSGSGSSGTGNQPIVANGSNAVPITVNKGAANFVNIPNVSVTVCAPGTSKCQTIDNIQLDTGSYGLRIVSSAASQVLGSLPVSTAQAGGQLAECTQFADGYTWGTVRSADVKIGGETASNIPVQVIGDLEPSTVPSSSCVSGSDERTTDDIGANGILGVGNATYDCGVKCLDAAQSTYYSCPGGTNCTATATPLTQQVVNPVTRFAADNNGVIVQLPPIDDNGAASASGTLVFGIGTQSNNTLTGVTKFGTDGFGNLSGSYKNNSVTTFFDTGSNGTFFADSSITACSSSTFYCPSSAQSLSNAIRGSDGTSGTVTFKVISARSLTSSGSKFAFSTLAGNFGDSNFFDFGLPFFYGRHVYVGFDQPGTAPYVAF